MKWRPNSGKSQGLSSLPEWGRSEGLQSLTVAEGSRALPGSADESGRDGTPSLSGPSAT